MLATPNSASIAAPAIKIIDEFWEFAVIPASPVLGGVMLFAFPVDGEVTVGEEPPAEAVHSTVTWKLKVGPSITSSSPSLTWPPVVIRTS